MKLFSKVISKIQTFPEYNNLENALQESIKNQEKSKKEFEIAEGPHFTEFARKQTSVAINDVLVQINSERSQAGELYFQGNTAMSQMKADFAKLKDLNERIRSKRKDCEQIKARSEKSIKAAQKAEAKVETLRIKNSSSPEFSKASVDYDVAVRQKQTDITAYEERQQQLNTEEKEYKKELIKTILTNLSQYLTSKIENSASLVSIGERIEELSGQIPPLDDPSIDSLQTELQALASEPLE